jgi:hypothetical protein
MQVALHNNVKVYNLTAGKSLPEWLEEKKKNRGTAGGEKRIELVHDLEFPHFTRMMFRSPNGSYLFAAGDYPPRLKCYDVNELSMKYSFNADMPIMGGVALSPDFRKFALRGQGRVITVHHSAVILDRLRVPHQQRCLEYHPHAAELLSGGASAEVFRISLETGAFVESYKTSSASGINAIAMFDTHAMTLTAGENGVCEAWDSRMGTPAGQLQIAGSDVTGVEAGSKLTHVSADTLGGLIFAVGTSDGQVVLYDIRSSKPVLCKDHMNSLPIVKTYFYAGKEDESTHVVSADTGSVKIWDRHDGANFTTIEAPAEIYDFTVVKSQHNLAAPYKCADSGVICLCCDTPKVQVHFVPQLGVAPKWSSFLDAITEEMEETDTTVVYDDYRFISKTELDTLGLSADSVNDGRIRPAMHGAYIENVLYRELKAVADPQGFNRFVEQARNAKKRNKSEARISKFKRVDPEAEAAKAAPEGGSVAPLMKGMTPAVMELISQDPRFANKVGKGGFQMDKKNPEFMKLFGKVEAQRKEAAERRARYDEHQFRIVADDEQEAADDGAGEAEEVDEAREALRKKAARRTTTSASEAASLKRKADGVTMMESKEGAAFTATDQQTHVLRRAERRKSMTLEDRLKKQRKEQRKAAR